MKRETYQNLIQQAQDDVRYYREKLEEAEFKLRALENFDKQELQELS